jgi:preprotein translocase subunit SecA
VRPGADESRLARFRALVSRIDAFALRLEADTDDGLRTTARLLQARARNGADLDALLPEAFALAREAAARSLGQRPYDVQLVVAAALHAGTSVEMGPGEGKTLAVALAAYLNGLTGAGVHVVALHEHANERSYQAMAPLYRFLGVTAARLFEGSAAADRRDAYAADVTYCALDRLCYDFLVDQRVHDPGRRVQRGHACAVVDDALSGVGNGGVAPRTLQADERRGGEVCDAITPVSYFRRYARVGAVMSEARSSAAGVRYSFGRPTVVVPARTAWGPRFRMPFVADTRLVAIDHIEANVRTARHRAQPVLVVVQTEELAAAVRVRLAARGHEHAWFDATVDEPDVAEAARVLAGAGRPGAVTVFTGYLGGLDVPLGGPDGDEREAAIAAGGLLVLRFVTSLLWARAAFTWAARHGEPGEIHEVVLSDPLGIEPAWWSAVARRLARLALTFDAGGEAVAARLLDSRFARRHLDGVFRSHLRPLHDFDGLVDHQRELNYARRRAVIHEDGEALRDRTAACLHAAVARLAARAEDVEGLRAAVAGIHPVVSPEEHEGNGSSDPAALVRRLGDALVVAYDTRRAELGVDAVTLERRAHRQGFEDAWAEHIRATEAVRKRLWAALPMSDEALMHGLREVARRYEEIEADLPVDIARRLFRDEDWRRTP